MQAIILSEQKKKEKTCAVSKLVWKLGMEEFFVLVDQITSIHLSLKKFATFTVATKQAKINQIKTIQADLKKIIKHRQIGAEARAFLIKRYRLLGPKFAECFNLLKVAKNSEENTDEETSDEESAEETDFSDIGEEENKMPPKLDLNVALKVVKPFDGSAINLQSYIESIELLKDYAEEVPEGDIVKFLKITLTGTARGVFDGIGTVDDAIAALKTRFSVKLTPKAVENEMVSKQQSNKSISDFGDEISKLASKLAAAHVSQGTFASESAASNLVESVAVRAFVGGLKDPTTQFLLKARNPATLNKAISDALECGPGSSKPNETALWFTGNQRGHSSGRGRGNRGNSRGTRGNYHNNSQQNNGSYNGNYHNNNNNRRGRNRYNNNNNNGNNGRNRHVANIAQQESATQATPAAQQTNQNQVRQEDANLIDLFR